MASLLFGGLSLGEVAGGIGAIVTSIINFVAELIKTFISYVKKFYEWMAEHPLSAVLCIANFVVLIS